MVSQRICVLLSFRILWYNEIIPVLFTNASYCPTLSSKVFSLRLYILILMSSLVDVIFEKCFTIFEIYFFLWHTNPKCFDNSEGC